MSTTFRPPQMELPVQEGVHYFDLYHGIELKPERQGDKVVLSFRSRGQGIRRDAGHKGAAHSMTDVTV